MGRCLLILALLYGYGAAAFEGQRPRMLDRPLREFHQAAQTAAIEGRRALAVFDVVRNLRSIETGMRRLNRAL